MYETYFGLNSKPFQLNPDPSFYFGSKQHRRAKAYLEYGVQRSEGFIVITGEVGAGKTTIVRGLIASLDAKKVVFAHLETTQLDAEDTLKLVGAAFGVRVTGLGKADILLALEAFLVNKTRLGMRCLLIVDEAQNLTPRAVEELRMLSNFQSGQQALLQTFLVGQPEFRAILHSPSMLQLRQRVTAACHIGPLDGAETQGYITHRLQCAGSTGRPSFDTAAFEKIFIATGGIPRRINLVCDRLLLLGLLAKKDNFSAQDVDEVVMEIHDESVGHSRSVTNTHADEKTSSHPVMRSGSAIDINLEVLQVTPALADAMSRQIEGLGVEHYDGRMRRLEGSMLRVERVNLEILVMLQKLVSAVRAPSTESSP